jgi:MFS family permease
MSENPSTKSVGKKGVPGKMSDYPKLIPLWIGLFIDILGFYIIVPFLPALIEIYKTDAITIGWLLATNAIFTLFSAPIWGKLSDKYGRKPMLLIAESGTCAAFLILAFSNSLELLFLARIVDGLFGGNYPLTKAIITDSVPPKDRGVQMTNIGVAHTMAGLVAPGIGGILSFVLIFGPEYPLALSGLVAAGLSFATIITTYFYIEESWPKEKRDKAEKELKIKINLRKNKDATFVLGQYALHTFSFIMYVSTLAIFIGLILGLDTVGVSIMLTISGVSRAIVRFSVFKPTLTKLGEKKTMRLGLLLLILAFFLVGLFGILYPEPWIFIVIVVIVSYGVSCSRGVLISKVTQTVSPKEMGKINGYTTTLDSLALIVGPILGTFLLQEFNPFYYGFFMTVLAFGAYIMVFKEIIPFRQKQQALRSNKEE